VCAFNQGRSFHLSDLKIRRGKKKTLQLVQIILEDRYESAAGGVARVLHSLNLPPGP
jgi:hypothetical protein